MGPKKPSNVLALRLSRRDPALLKKLKVSCSLHLFSYTLIKIIAVQIVGGKRVDQKKSQLKSMALVPTRKQHHNEKALKAIPGKCIIYIFKYNT